MELIGLISAFAATAISVVALSRIAYKEHDASRPLTLSELAASSQPLLAQFRKILIVCGTLFAVTMYLYVGPQSNYSVWVILAWTVTYVGELFLAFIPAHKDALRLHNIFARFMALGMLAMAFLFYIGLSSGFKSAELAISIAMTFLGIMTLSDKSRFIFYELGFIFLSHISIVVAALALR